MASWPLRGIYAGLREGAGGRHRSSFVPSDSCYKVLQMQSISVVCRSAAAAASKMCCFENVLLLLLPLLLLLVVVVVAILLCDYN